MQNWATEIRKWLGRDRLRVFAADQTGGIKAFCVGKNYQVLIIGYEKVSCSCFRAEGGGRADSLPLIAPDGGG